MKVYLLRHAESAPSDDVPEPDWPLSERGHAAARALVSQLDALGIDAIYSSPYPRAVETVRPFAEAVGLPLRRDSELRERRLAAATLSEAEFRAGLARCWAEPEFALPGGESNLACQERMVRCVTTLVGEHDEQTLLISSHGNALSLLLGSLDSSFGFESWRAMRNPDLFRIEYRAGRALGPGTRVDLSLR